MRYSVSEVEEGQISRNLEMSNVVCKSVSTMIKRERLRIGRSIYDNKALLFYFGDKVIVNFKQIGILFYYLKLIRTYYEKAKLVINNFT